MRRWILSVLLSLIPVVYLLFYFYGNIQHAVCLSSGGKWLGIYRGCDLAIDQGFYSLTISPFFAVIFAAFWLLLALLIYLVLKHFRVLMA